MKYSQAQLKKLEAQAQQAGYQVRYEKGNFRTGACLVKENKLVIINKFLSLEGRINSLAEIVQQIDN